MDKGIKIMDQFESRFAHLGAVDIPSNTDTRIMMMPLVLGDMTSVPDTLSPWRDTIRSLFDMSPCRDGIAYLTIDCKRVSEGMTHRRSGLHVDGIYRDGVGGWGGGWGAVGTGMLTVSDVPGCCAYRQMFYGWPGDEGDCSHLADQARNGTTFEPGLVYWVDGLCVHESLPMPKDTHRSFVRLSMPSDAPWFEGYTENPLGVAPAGKILPRRKFMSEA